MKLKIYILVLSILLSSNISTYAQNSMQILKYYTKADSLTIDPNSFFPMQVGNFWQYAFQNEIVKEQYVTKDSLTENSTTLYWINDFPWYLLDTNNTIYGWHPSGQIQYMDCYFKLDANLGEEWIVWMHESDSTHPIIRKIESIFEAEYLGVKTIFKEIVEYARDENQDYLRHKYILGAGLGIVNKRNDSDVEPPEYLISAILNGDTLGTIVGVKNDNSKLIPSDIELFQNYPNPFNPSTIISYQLPENSFVNLVVYNALGQKVAELVNQHQSVGQYSVKFDASNLPSGVYIYKLQADEFSDVKKMLLTK